MCERKAGDRVDGGDDALVEVSRSRFVREPLNAHPGIRKGAARAAADDGTEVRQRTNEEDDRHRVDGHDVVRRRWHAEQMLVALVHVARVRHDRKTAVRHVKRGQHWRREQRVRVDDA